MTPASVMLQRLREGRHLRQLSRFGVASVVSTVTAQVVFLVAYALGAPAWTASALGYVSGMAPNYLISRRWAFGRTGRSQFSDEVLPYAVVVGTSGVLAVLGTTAAEGEMGVSTWAVHG